MKSPNYLIHKRVKKKEMIFEYTLMGVLGLLVVYLIIYAVGLFPNITSKFNITAVGGVFVATYALIWQLYSAIKAKQVIVTLGLNATVKGKDVLISASITNAGSKSIYPLLTNLYINEGIVEQVGNINVVKYESVTEHNFNQLAGKEPCFDCAVAQQCRRDAQRAFEDSTGIDAPAFPPQKADDALRFKDTLRFAYNLRLLSYHSLIHVMPKETFSEEAIFTLSKSGYYRIFMIYTDKEWKDCICKSAVVKID